MPQPSNNFNLVQVLEHVFRLLRAGQILEAQHFLLEKNFSEQFLWLIGSLPHFDNIEFAQTLDCDQLVHSDCDREQNFDKLSSAQDSGQFYASGNRSNLLFVETCLDHIQQEGR